ncbi:hypothetical protein RJ641_033200 [Dillenia turbinata]|uniref:Uncharacterized protein n=1 Tax=Dillenia turbinata TaxID=194707 RepID=A0AAN8VLB9_9MAGN
MGGEIKSPRTESGENMKKMEEPKVIVVLGATGAGKSRLAIDLASHFPIEIINADSMQVYRGLDVLTNKVPLNDQKGVPHHLLGTISPNLEFTSKDFRDSAIPIINDILTRKCLPVIVGGTNYYIQALVSKFLLDDSVEEEDGTCMGEPVSTVNMEVDHESYLGEAEENFSDVYDRLKELDPVAANRIHPNDHRKAKQYLSLYARTSVLPSKLVIMLMCILLSLKSQPVMFLKYLVMLYVAGQNWTKADNFRYNCCFICVDASLPTLDHHVEQRVDTMIESGLLNEVYDIYKPDADYTRGLRQAIGVREFEKFLKFYHFKGEKDQENYRTNGSCLPLSADAGNDMVEDSVKAILNSPKENLHKVLLQEAIGKLKLNTRRLVRRQRRRLSRLESLFGWKIHYVDATEAISSMAGVCQFVFIKLSHSILTTSLRIIPNQIYLLCVLGNSDDRWEAQVIEPAVQVIRSFLCDDESPLPCSEIASNTVATKLAQRDLWTQYICKACGDKLLRGALEWEQHQRGRGHRKRISRLRKCQGLGIELLQEPCPD